MRALTSQTAFSIQVLKIKQFERGMGVWKPSSLGPWSWISAVCTQPEVEPCLKHRPARRERGLGEPAVWPL